MRTTLDIEDDLMNAIKELARRDGSTAGALVSKLLRSALTQTGSTGTNELSETPANYGFRPFAGGKIVSNDDINKLRDELGI